MTSKQPESHEFHGNPPSERQRALLEKAGTLAVEVGVFADRLSQVSRQALDVVNVGLEGTELGDEWPLTSSKYLAYTLGAKLKERIADQLVGRAPAPESPSDHLRATTTYYDRNLAEVYGDSRPRIAFTRDLIGWSTKMSALHCPMIVHVNLCDLARVEVATFDDVALTRAYWQERVDAFLRSGTDGKSVDAAQGEITPYIWVSPHVVLSGEAADLTLFSPYVAPRAANRQASTFEITAGDLH